MPTRMVPQISGRVVNSLDDITVQEVPTDGTMRVGICRRQMHLQ